MSDGRRRAAILVAVVAVAVVSFLLVRDGGGDGDAPVVTAPPATSAATTATTPSGGAPADATTPARRPTPRIPQVVVRGGAPVGGVQTLRFRSGDRIRFEVVSDAPDEVHLHVYDIELPVGPGRPARFSTPATVEGIFEVELHGDHTQIASVVVEP